MSFTDLGMSLKGPNKEAAMLKPQADYGMPSEWGRRISWFDISQFQTRNLNRDTFSVDGHYTPVPQVGQTMVAEFQRSWIVFKFVSVRKMSDPPDQFFAEVRAIKQVPKEPA